MIIRTANKFSQALACTGTANEESGSSEAKQGKLHSLEAAFRAFETFAESDDKSEPNTLQSFEEAFLSFAAAAGA